MSRKLKAVTIRLAITLLCSAAIVEAQGFVPTGDPAADKMLWLQQQIPSVLTNGQCIDPITRQPANTGIPAQIGGTLWPTLVQAVDFLSPYPGPTPLCLTSGTEGHDSAPSGRGHREGFKIDLRIIDQINTFQDGLSLFITQTASPGGCRGDVNLPATPSNDHAPLWISKLGPSSGSIFAMEHPIPPSLNPCPNPYTGVAPHWDFLTSYRGLTVSPTTITVKVGDYMSVSPSVTTLKAIPIQTTPPWMFDYYFPADSTETIATIDRTGIITGTAGNAIGVSVGSSVMLVSEGPYFGFVDITVNPPDPPGGGPICPQGATTSGCWSWQGNSWNWNPPTPTTQNPKPPAPPPGPFGVCPPGPMTVLVPCWQWNPIANNGGGAWVFIQPGGSSGTTTSPPITAVGSRDPNDISGPSGVGAGKYLSGASPLSYAVFFGNDPSATAPAQKVVVTTQLDPSRFNLSSVVLGPIIFPGVPGVIPPAVPLAGVGGFSSQVDLRPATNLLVNVSASLDQSGLLTWTLQSIDPTTGQPPIDPTSGFLPPGGEGTVSFLTNLNPGLPTGGSVSDQASVVFDANAAIPTSVWTNTIDATAPVSSVAALPASESLPAFTVTWRGTDVGAGVQDFTIFASDNDGTFVPWLTNTTATSATFFGQLGHKYAFYSIARDLVGNVEAAKTAAEATTQVTTDTTPPVTTAAASPAPNSAGWNNTNVTFTLNSTDSEPGGTGVKQIQWSLTGAQTGSSSVPGSTTSVTISTEGTTTLTYFGTDNAGNIETAKTVTIKLDKTPPSIAGVRSPAANANGWNNTSVTVSFTCADSLSGLAPGSPPAPTILSAEGAAQSVSGTCLDLAGNAATTTVSAINIDKTPPVVTASANPATFWPPNGKMVTVTVSGTMSDNLSGINPSTATFTVQDSYGLVQPSGSVSLASNGTYSFTISLEARRDGQDKNGRLYRIVVSAQDNAGNPSSSTTTVIVPHDQGK